MNKEFIPYEQALELKELGFDERCLGHYWENLFYFQTTHTHPSTMPNSHESCLAPLYQQAFRWFREKYDLHRHICYFEDYQVWNGDLYELSTSSLMNFPMELSGYKTYEEAELACLKKLIEIVQGGNQ